MNEDVLVGVVKEYHEEVVVVPDVLLIIVELLVLNTPLVAENDEVVLVFEKDVEFKRQEAGMMKQQGKPVYEVVLGSKTPE